MGKFVGALVLAALLAVLYVVATAPAGVDDMLRDGVSPEVILTEVELPEVELPDVDLP